MNPNTPQIEDSLRLLMAHAEEGKIAIRDLLAQHPYLVTKEIANAARALLDDAVLQLNPVATSNLELIAFTLYDALGNSHAAFDALLPNLQLGFMMANQPELYIKVANSALRKAKQAEGFSVHDVIVKLHIIATDCLYFAAKCSQPRAQDHLFRAALKVLTNDIADETSVSLPNEWISRLATLSCVLMDEVIRSPFLATDSELKPTIQAVAHVVETFVPLRFDVVNREHAVMAACSLAKLSYSYGNWTNADARLEAAAAMVTNVNEQLKIAIQRYDGSRRRLAPESLTTLRRRLNELFDLHRASFRSRIGRLFARQEDADIEGIILQDDSADPNVGNEDFLFSIERTKARLLLDLIVDRHRSLDLAIASRAAVLEGNAFEFAPLDKSQKDLIHYENLLISEQPIGSNAHEDIISEYAKLVAQTEMIYAEENAWLCPTADIARVTDVKMALEPGEMLIEYCVPHHFAHPARDLFALAVTREHIQRIHVPLDDDEWIGDASRIAVDGQSPLDASPLGDHVIECRVAIRSGDDARASKHLEWLHDKIIGPLLDAGIHPNQFSRWIIVPHGPLHYVPFGALAPVGGVPLIVQVALTICPSASTWFHLSTRKLTKPVSFLGIANPKVNYANVDDLTQAEKELVKLKPILSSLDWLELKGPDATKAALCTKVPGKSLVHFATHGDFPEHRVIDDHRILLAAEGNHDGYLHANEIRALDLSFARLVVLNICNGALCRTGPGDEPYGLMSAILTAGAQNVLGTLWPVGDTSARVFMTFFYHELLAHGPAEALRFAASESIKAGLRLSQWAGYVTIGPGRPFDGPG